MRKIKLITLKRIPRTSASQFSKMKVCSYRSLLEEAFDKSPPLPSSPNAYYGTVIHKILEQILKGYIKTNEEFENAFHMEVKSIENKLIRDDFAYLVPLNISAKDFTLKKLLLKGQLSSLAQKKDKSDNYVLFSEKWYESNDKIVSGKIDLIVQNKFGTEIIDFKSGTIKTNQGKDKAISSIKTEYLDQLQIYAYLYFENTGIFPNKLSIVSLSKQKTEFFFTKEQCQQTYEYSKALLNTTNESIENLSFNEMPSLSKCKLCLYKPACKFYLSIIEVDTAYSDVGGVIQEVMQFKNGSVSLYLGSGSKNTIVSQLPPRTYDELSNLKNKMIFIFNLKKDKIDNIYSALKNTLLYEL